MRKKIGNKQNKLKTTIMSINNKKETDPERTKNRLNTIGDKQNKQTKHESKERLMIKSINKLEHK